MGAPESCRTRPFGGSFGHKTPPDPWKPPVEARLSQLPSESSFPIKIGFLCLVIRFLSSNQIKTFQNSKLEISAETGDGLKLPELITNHLTAYDFIKRKKRKSLECHRGTGIQGLTAATSSSSSPSIVCPVPWVFLASILGLLWMNTSLSWVGQRSRGWHLGGCWVLGGVWEQSLTPVSVPVQVSEQLLASHPLWISLCRTVP